MAWLCTELDSKRPLVPNNMPMDAEACPLLLSLL